MADVIFRYDVVKAGVRHNHQENGWYNVPDTGSPSAEEIRGLLTHGLSKIGQLASQMAAMAPAMAPEPVYDIMIYGTSEPFVSLKGPNALLLALQDLVAEADAVLRQKGKDHAEKKGYQSFGR